MCLSLTFPIRFRSQNEGERERGKNDKFHFPTIDIEAVRLEPQNASVVHATSQYLLPTTTTTAR